VVVLRDGDIQQVDTPQNLYLNPVNLFVAAFIGSPSMNFVLADVAHGNVTFAGTTVPLPADSPLASADRKVILGIRPGGFTTELDLGWPVIEVEPTVVELLGDEQHVIFDVDAARVDTDAIRAAVDARAPDDALLLPEDRARFTARLLSDRPVAVGETLRLALNPGRLAFFDPDTGVSLAGAGP
jgi:multiple sugar transport system ATP-binding protein